MSSTRRRWLQMALGAAASGGLYARVVEPSLIHTEVTRIHIPGLKGTIRIAHLSDLHSSPEVATSLLDEAARLAIQSNPDLICLTGDYITGPDWYDGDGLIRLFRRLSQAAPTFSILGNHDITPVRSGNGAPARRRWSGEAIADLLRQGNTHYLENDRTVFEKGADAISVIGVADLWRPEFAPLRAFRGAPRDLPVVFLCHNPDGKDATAAFHWDLMLSGHTHGGQVLVPFVEPHWAPVLDKRFIAGRYDWEDRQLFITRGVGSINGLRFSCPPEVSILDLHG